MKNKNRRWSGLQKACTIYHEVSLNRNEREPHLPPVYHVHCESSASFNLLDISSISLLQRINYISHRHNCISIIFENILPFLFKVFLCDTTHELIIKASNLCLKTIPFGLQILDQNFDGRNTAGVHKS